MYREGVRTVSSLILNAHLLYSQRSTSRHAVMSLDFRLTDLYGSLSFSAIEEGTPAPRHAFSTNWFRLRRLRRDDQSWTTHVHGRGSVRCGHADGAAGDADGAAAGPVCLVYVQDHSPVLQRSVEHRTAHLAANQAATLLELSRQEELELLRFYRDALQRLQRGSASVGSAFLPPLDSPAVRFYVALASPADERFF